MMRFDVDAWETHSWEIIKDNFPNQMEFIGEDAEKDGFDIKTIVKNIPYGSKFTELKTNKIYYYRNIVDGFIEAGRPSGFLNSEIVKYDETKKCFITNYPTEMLDEIEATKLKLYIRIPYGWIGWEVDKPASAWAEMTQPIVEDSQYNIVDYGKDAEYWGWQEENFAEFNVGDVHLFDSDDDSGNLAFRFTLITQIFDKIKTAEIIMCYE